jgi:dTDP-4-amino-4,6-dideoxygalactose transaminase
VVTPSEAPGAESVWHLYVIRVEQRDLLRDCLVSCGIGTVIHYPIPIHLQPAYHDLGYKPGDFPVTEECAQRILSLPMFAELTQDQIELITQTVREFISANPSDQPPSQPFVKRAGSGR